MKRYLTFFGEHYYPSGGMDDLLNDFDTIEECKNAIDNRIKEGYNPDWYSIEEHVQHQWKYSWAHIYDTETRKKVWSK
jgi:hypothetical protein